MRYRLVIAASLLAATQVWADDHPLLRPAKDAKVIYRASGGSTGSMPRPGAEVTMHFARDSVRIEGEAARGYVIIDRDAGRMTMVMTDQRQHTEHESDPGMPPGIPAGGNPPSR